MGIYGNILNKKDELVKEEVKELTLEEVVDLYAFIVEAYQNEEILDNIEENSFVNESGEIVALDEGANIDAIKIVKNLKKDLKENSEKIKKDLYVLDKAKIKKDIDEAKKMIKDAKAKFNTIDFDSIGSVILGFLASGLQNLVPTLPFVGIRAVGSGIAIKGFRDLMMGASGLGSVKAGAALRAGGGIGIAVVSIVQAIKGLVAEIKQIVRDAKNDNITAGTFNIVRAKISNYFDKTLKLYENYEKALFEEVIIIKKNPKYA